MTLHPDEYDGNAFHRASLWIEELKYGPGPRRLEGADREEITGQMEALLRAAGVTTMTGAELVDTLDFYAASFSELLRLPRLVTKSIFADGVMHGIALAAGLAGPRPLFEQEGQT